MIDLVIIAITDGPDIEEILRSLSNPTHKGVTARLKGSVLSDPLDDTTNDEGVEVDATINGLTSPSDHRPNEVFIDVSCKLPDGRTFNGAGPYNIANEDIEGHALPQKVIGMLYSNQFISYGPL